MRIKDLRDKKLFMTQEEFAKAVGVHYVTVGKWERGQSGISAKHKRAIIRLCETQKIDYKEFEQ